MFFCKRWMLFFEVIQCLGAIFARIFRDFAQIFNKSQLFGVRLHPLQLCLLHHCLCLSEADRVLSNSYEEMVAILRE